MTISIDVGLAAVIFGDVASGLVFSNGVRYDVDCALEKQYANRKCRVHAGKLGGDSRAVRCVADSMRRERNGSLGSACGEVEIECRED